MVFVIMEKRKGQRGISTTQIVKDIFNGDYTKSKPTTSTGGTTDRKRKYAGCPNVEWIKLPNSKDKNCFKYAKVGDLYINQGDNILIPNEEGDKPQIAHVAYMFEDPESKEKMCHAHFYCRGSDTILGNKADKRELFLVDHCENIRLTTVIDKAKVTQRSYKSNWHLSGGIDKAEISDYDDGKNYYFSKQYDYNTSRFVDFINDPKAKCMSCSWDKKQEDFNNVVSMQFYEQSIGHSFVEYKKVKYYVGSGVFIDYERESIPKSKNGKEETEEEFDGLVQAVVDGTKLWMTREEREEIFPEKYRNQGNNQEQYLENPCEPYTIGVIEKIQQNGRIVIREFWRVEDTADKKYGDPNLVYWTKRLYTITNLNKWKSVIKGKCFVAHTEHIPTSKHHWIREGPYRFYFNKQYDPDKDTFINVPPIAKHIGATTRQNKRIKHPYHNPEYAPLWPELDTKLKSMDIYAGCGGLSNGLENAGLVETKWAIEIDPSAAEAFKLNNPNAKVLLKNCNDVLYLLLKNENVKIDMPQKGEIDIIVGGPPCQGFSIINRFKTAASAKRNRSQINTYLGFVDYYRPKYFIFENVRNFVSFNETNYFKLTLKCLLEIGYQITFGILQAGNYGLPQSRRRFFIIGAAPGLILPKMPEPTHCFGRFEKKIESIRVDNLLYDIGEEIGGAWGSLPFRRVTVRDAIEDLPSTDYNTMSNEMFYEENPNISSYAKNLRAYCNRENIVTEHECMQAKAIAKKRFELIPEGGDWTDLPNIRVPIEETFTLKLSYVFSTKNQNETTTRCCELKTTSPSKELTLIPFSVANSASRNNNWKGVYGRVTWDGIFKTVTTNPDPEGSQGRVIHPDQNRVMTVREFARAQGFHDEFLFAGSVKEKYRQIGNAVPPILAEAIGREIVKTMVEN